MCSLFLLLYYRWAVVVPRESDSRRPVKCELVIYMSPKVRPLLSEALLSVWKAAGLGLFLKRFELLVATKYLDLTNRWCSSYQHPLPRSLIPLARTEVEEPKFNVPDPVIVLTDKRTSKFSSAYSSAAFIFLLNVLISWAEYYVAKCWSCIKKGLFKFEYGTDTKYKYLAEAPGDKAQIERFYRACRGVEQVRPSSHFMIPDAWLIIKFTFITQSHARTVTNQ